MSIATVHSRVAGGVRRVFQALRVPRYRILWFGTLFSFLGMQMQVVARGYLAFDLTGRNTALGGVMIAFGVPRLLFALWGGVVADRMAKRNVLILWQSVLALGSGLLTLAIATGQVRYWMLIAMAVLTGTAFSFITPARQAFIGDLVPDQLVGNATVLQQASMNGTRVFGPALAGLLIALPLVGMAGVYALTTLGFIVAAANLILLPPGEPEEETNDKSPVRDLLDSLRYVRADRPIALLLVMSFFVVALAFPYQAFLASVARGVFHRGSLGLGALSSLAAIGALTATLAAAWLAGHRRVWQFQALAGIGFAVALIAFAVAPHFAIALVAILFVGAFASGFQSLNNGLTMTLTESHYYGRIQALAGITWSLFGILSLPLGIVADRIGIRTTLAVMGAAALISTVVLVILARVLRVEPEVAERISALNREPAEQDAPPPRATDGARPVRAGQTRS